MALIHSSSVINQSFYYAFPDLLSVALLLAEAGRDIFALSVLFRECPNKPGTEIY